VVTVPEAVEAAIFRSVARDPDERFASAAEFSAALGGRAPAPKPAPAPRPAAAPAPTPADATAVAPGAKARGCLAVLAIGLVLASLALKAALTL
jgi:serine/threonine-protein kinase